MYTILIIIICILIVIAYYYRQRLDTFMVLPGNVFEVPKDTQLTMYDRETITLNTMFQTLASERVLPDYKRTFQKQPTFQRLEIEPILVEYLQTLLETAFKTHPEYSSTTLDKIKRLYNVWWSRDGNDRVFVFNIDIVNPQKAMARKLLVSLRIRNYSRFVDDTNTTNYLLTTSLQPSDMDLLYMQTDDQKQRMNVDALDTSASATLYRTKNTLYLLDPFLTSGADMTLTTAQQDAFAKRLEGLAAQTPKERRGFCFGTSTGAVTETDCVDRGGVWDYPPEKDADCPFYMANKNYPNAFGVLNGEICQLPMNMQLVGNRYYSAEPQYAPLCYNCKEKQIGRGTLGFCCDTQGDKTLYPTLASPDYAFAGDIQQRAKYTSTFGEKGLSVE